MVHAECGLGDGEGAAEKGLGSAVVGLGVEQDRGLVEQPRRRLGNAAISTEGGDGDGVGGKRDGYGPEAHVVCLVGHFAVDPSEGGD